ncbi:hypothetical protein RhiirC2_763926, partial [Rhizophagus irregularis]
RCLASVNILCEVSRRWCRSWIQDGIKAGKLRDPIYTESGTRNAWLFNEFL